MAIINSCCFWKSLRKGCLASALYTLVYFMGACYSISGYLYDERDYLSGRVDKPITKSFLGTSPMNLWFSMMMLGCAVLGVISSIFVIIGLRKDQREFLAPFIIIMSLDLFLGLLHFAAVVIAGDIKFEPLTGTLFTIDFFILCLNMYCLVCVVSQYQEYKEYRCANHFIINNGTPRCTTPEKSCIVLHQSKTSPINNGHTNITLIQEAHLNGSANDLKCTPDILTTIVNENKEDTSDEQSRSSSSVNVDHNRQKQMAKEEVV
ncbi:hypothetical protein PVAND_007555 [Polypedilum vanderplanki]|uniref:Uncharacterized protein n=1 Tax=Polypedilum vanderplanki TaxID=319348 RepID=A0A9J6C7A0_POLVA|nr:hypothetical protein PVAND_007555 [Polypedilum vanderplanki]